MKRGSGAEGEGEDTGGAETVEGLMPPLHLLMEDVEDPPRPYMVRQSSKGVMRAAYDDYDDQYDWDTDEEIEELKAQLRELLPRLAQQIGGLLAPAAFALACAFVGFTFHKRPIREPAPPFP